MFLSYLQSRNADQTLNGVRAFIASLGPLTHEFECAFETTEDFGGKQAAYVDIFPAGAELAKDHKKFGGIFVRVWMFGEPAMFTSGLFLGAERAEQSEPRRGVNFTRRRLGQGLVAFETAEGFSYHTWSSGHFSWTTKSSRAVARQLEQFISFRQDAADPTQEMEIEQRVGKALVFLDQNLRLLKPISDFGKEIIQEYYSENLPELTIPSKDSTTLTDFIPAFEIALGSVEVGVRAKTKLTHRIASCLLSKRFLIATGLAGSGKTKLSQALAEWLTPKRAASTGASPHFALIPVGADWTGNDNLVGYPNGLDNQSYNSKPALELMLHAKDQPEVPHFLILDEMNLSHVERYFADILSAMESEAAVPLHQDEQRTANGREIPKAIVLPPNLFIIGTVNVDETTYMFSPKVLDRANVIEFRMEAEEIGAFLEAPKAVRLGELNGKGASFGQNFVAAAADKSRAVPEVVKANFKEEMLLFFKLLQKHHAEFGYRTSYEAGRFMHFYKELGGYADDDATWFDAAMDAVIVQKLLPKLHGSRTKLEGLLWALGYACGADWGKMSAAEFQEACLEAGEAQNESKYSPEAVLDALKGAEPRYPLSFDKILRMYRKLVRDQFVTFAEA